MQNGSDYVCDVVTYGTDGDSSGERLVARKVVRLTHPDIHVLAGQVVETFAASLPGAGTAVEVRFVAHGRTSVWFGPDDEEQGLEAKAIADCVRAALATKPKIIFDPVTLRADWFAAPGETVRARYDNPPTVSVMSVPTSKGLLLIRRGLSHGFGKVALPGGHQTLGETWQMAGAREVLEETGLELDPDLIVVDDVITVPSGHNLIFGRYTGEVGEFEPRTDSETLEVLFTESPVETAFSTHTDAVSAFFARAERGRQMSGDHRVRVDGDAVQKMTAALQAHRAHEWWFATENPEPDRSCLSPLVLQNMKLGYESGTLAPTSAQFRNLLTTAIHYQHKCRALQRQIANAPRSAADIGDSLG